MIPNFTHYRENVLAFVEACAPSEGVFDEAAWTASGRWRVLDPRCTRFFRPASARVVRTRTLEERRRDNDWTFASTPGGVESIEGSQAAVETLFLLGELERLSPDNRAAWAASLNRHQDERTGHFPGPFIPPPDHPSWADPQACTHTRQHMQDHLACAVCPTLMLLGARSRVPLSEGTETGLPEARVPP